MLSAFSVAAQFQPTPVVRSQEKTIINGKRFYIHTVLKGQTLYSISKVYEVTQEEIKNANPGIDVLNLVEGLALRIPDSAAAKAALYPANRENFDAHVVKRKETLYSIARKYKVSEDVIHYYNPWAKYGIKADQTLWIPKNRELHDISTEARSDDAFYYYTTKQKDTLYSIAKIYGVEVTDIIEANPELRNGLRPEMNIKIPRLKQPEVIETAPRMPDTIPCIAPDASYTFQVALMLPLYASLNAEETELSDSTGVRRGLRGRNFAEFYEGFLLAVDSVKKAGISVNIHVYDTERDTNKTKRVTRELASLNPDIIIGPVYPEDVDIAGRFASFRNVALVSPLSTRTSLVEQNNNIIQIVPSRQAESYAMANYIRQFKKGRIILIRGNDSISLQNSWRFKKSLLENMPVDESGNQLYFKDYRLNDSLFTQLGKILSKDEDNLLVVFSDYEPDVISLVTRLIPRISSFPVRLFGMPSWQTWTNIDLTFLHTLNLHIVSPFYTDYSDPRVKSYLKKSRNIFGYEPYEIGPQGFNYSMLGHDIGYCFLSALKQMGGKFLPCLDQIEADELLTRFHFVKTATGGYINNSFNIIEYRSDFTVNKIGTISGEPSSLLR
jgi:LysM repeat protein/ABC-type branched-subunit amino acid transport system substrate-binding protein